MPEKTSRACAPPLAVPHHREQLWLGYAPETLFTLVRDIPEYPAFLPWCLDARIIDDRGKELDAELVIGFRALRERYISRVTCAADGSQIDARAISGPFRHLLCCWKFTPQDGGCWVEVSLCFAFSSRVLSLVMGPLFHHAQTRMVQAFAARARRLHGAPRPRTPRSSQS